MIATISFITISHNAFYLARHVFIISLTTTTTFKNIKMCCEKYFSVVNFHNSRFFLNINSNCNELEFIFHFAPQNLIIIYKIAYSNSSSIVQWNKTVCYKRISELCRSVRANSTTGFNLTTSRIIPRLLQKQYHIIL